MFSKLLWEFRDDLPRKTVTKATSRCDFCGSALDFAATRKLNLSLSRQGLAGFYLICADCRFDNKAMKALEDELRGESYEIEPSGEFYVCKVLAEITD